MSYFQDLSPAEKVALHNEFENSETTDERRVEILTLVRDGADEAKMGPACPRCKHHSFHAPWHEALIEGHVYSDAGAAEVYITGYCEFCFDLITAEPDEDDDNLPGMWSHADFTGGDPDERSYAQRDRDAHERTTDG